MPAVLPDAIQYDEIATRSTNTLARRNLRMVSRSSDTAPMSTPKNKAKAAAKKPAAPVKDLDTKKDPKGGPSPKFKRVVVLQS
jgi:hypothetical protein